MLFRSNLTAAICECGLTEMLREQMRLLESEEKELKFEKQQLDRARKTQVQLPSAGEIKAAARKCFVELARSSPEFARLMKLLIPRIIVYPYRLCDGGKIVLRARFTLHLAGLVPGGQHVEGLDAILSREMCVDLFDPPQREQYRQQIVMMMAATPDKPFWQIGEELGITDTAVQRSVALDRKMRSLGLTDPYVPVTEPPEDCGRLRRHKRAKYRFEPLVNFSEVSPPGASPT